MPTFVGMTFLGVVRRRQPSCRCKPASTSYLFDMHSGQGRLYRSAPSDTFQDALSFHPA